VDVLPLLLLAASAAGAPQDALRLRGADFTLDNGLRVFVFEDHSAPRVAVHLLVQAGAAEDSVGASGTAHMLEHLVFAGSRALGQQSFDQAMAATGGDANAWTHLDYTAFHQVVPPGALERALFLEADRLGWPLLQEEALRSERGVVLSERDQSLDTPHGSDAPALALALYGPDHPYGRPITGLLHEPANLGLLGITPARLHSFHQRYYSPSRCTLVVGGDLDPLQVESWVRREFGRLPGREPAPRRSAGEAKLQGEERHLLVADVADRSLYLAWAGVPRGHPDEPALALAAWLLASGEASRLQQALVARGPAQRVAAWNDSWRLAGGFHLSVSTVNGGLAPLLTAVDRQLRRLAAQGPTEDELSRARSALGGAWLRAAEPLASRAELANQCLVTHQQPDCLARDLARYQAVSGEDLQAAVRRWLLSDQRVLLSVLSEAESGLALPGSSPLELP